MIYRNFATEGVTGSPDSPQWHAWRQKGIGASDAIVLAVGKGIVEEKPSWVGTMEALLAEKRGEVQHKTSNFAMRRGREGEKVALALYVDQTGIFVSPVFGECEARPFIRSSFDGMDIDESVIVEIKCPGAANHQAAHEGKVVDYYKPQLAHQALTAWGHPDTWDSSRQLHYVSCKPEDRDIAIVAHRCGKYARIAAALWDVEAWFWERVVSGEPLTGWDVEALIRKYLETERVFVTLKEQADKAKAEMTSLRDSLESAFLASGQRSLEAAGLKISKSVPKPVIKDYEGALRKLGYTDEQLASFRALGPINHEKLIETLPVDIVEQFREPGPLDGKAAVEGLEVPRKALEAFAEEPAPRITFRKVAEAEAERSEA